MKLLTHIRINLINFRIYESSIEILTKILKKEKCKEEIYSDEEFFLDLVSFYEQLIERVKNNGRKIE